MISDGNLFLSLMLNNFNSYINTLWIKHGGLYIYFSTPILPMELSINIYS